MILWNYIYIYDTEISDYILKHFSKSKGVPTFGIRPLNCGPKNCVHRLKGNDNDKYKSKGTLRNICVCTLGDLPTVLCNIHSLSPSCNLGTFMLVSWDPLCCMLCLVAQLCQTLCNPMDCSPPGSSVHEIFHARILEWVAISSSRKTVKYEECVFGNTLSPFSVHLLSWKRVARIPNPTPPPPDSLNRTVALYSCSFLSP